MIYSARIKKNIRYIRAYTILKKTTKQGNLLTRGFIKLFSLITPKSKEEQAE